MSTPFLGETKIFAFGFAPRGWAECNGQLLPINQNQALFSLLGTTYGGDGRVNFALPDLRDRVPVHEGSGFSLGQRGGEAAVTLTEAQIPQHQHFARGSGASGTTADPSNGYLAAASSALGPTYGPPDSPTLAKLEAVGATGGGQPHNNLQPYLSLCFAIALQGIFPSRN